MINFVSNSVDETLSLAKKLGKRLFCGAVILLTGDLGAGKTVFVKGLAQGMGYDGLVKSPTYNIMNIYEGELSLIHFDLYRIANEDEFLDIGGEEYLNSDNVCAIEWHEHAKDAIGNNFIEVTIVDIGENRRDIKITAQGQRHTDWLGSIA